MGDLEMPCISLPAGQFHIPKGFVSLKKGLCKMQSPFSGEAALFIDEHLCKVSEQPLKAASILSIRMFLAFII